MKISEIKEEGDKSTSELSDELEVENNKLSQEKIWKLFEATGELDGWEGDSIDISGEKTNPNESGFFATTVNAKNWNDFNSKKLVFKNCPNLKIIEASCLDLTGLEIKDCPRLETISAYNNKIKSLDLKGLSNLKELKIFDNQLSNLINLKDCGNIESLDIRNNQLTQLNLDNKNKLTDLDCSRNKIKNLNVPRVKPMILKNIWMN